jgi:drug/metabolite transporter (DMT)-like permease
VKWNLGLATLAASWGFISIVVSAVDLDATVLVFFRLALAAVTVVLVLAAMPRLGALAPGSGWPGLLAVGCVLAGHWFLFFETIKLASVAVAVLTVYTAPVFLAAAAPLVLPETRSRVALVALVPAGAGLTLVALGGNDGGAVRPLALATGLGAAASYAGLVIAAKLLVARLPPATVAFWSYAVAALALLPFLALADRVLPASGDELAGVLLLGIVFTGFSGMLYLAILRHVTAQAAGIIAFLEPVAAALLAWPLLDEPLGAATVAGGVLVLAAGVWVVLREPADAAAVEAPAPATRMQEPV